LIKVLAFDFDGVILESVSVKDQAVLDLFADLPLQKCRRILDLHHQNPGIARKERMTLFLEKGLGKEARMEEVASLLDRFAGLIWKGLMSCPEVNGIRNFLRIHANIPKYIVSAAPQEEVNAVAEKREFAGYFHRILGAPSKKTELLKKIIEIEKVRPDYVLFIGDKISDYKAAQSAGVTFVGSSMPNNPPSFPKNLLIIENFIYSSAVMNHFGL
jgi:phosphoglycolate phosphatase-like HAD superfamily hydrolase